MIPMCIFWTWPNQKQIIQMKVRVRLSSFFDFEKIEVFVQPQWKECPETPQTPKPRGDRDVKNKMVIAWRGTELSTEDGFDKDDVLQDAKIQKGTS